MKFPKALYILPLTIGPILYVSASEYEFENIKLNELSKEQNTYQPKDKLDEYIIKGATFSTKFVPLMDNGAEGSEYTNLIANEFKRFHISMKSMLQKEPHRLSSKDATIVITTHNCYEQNMMNALEKINSLDFIRKKTV